MFESLLFRSYFADNSNEIIRKLEQDFQLVFFTNSTVYPLIAEKMKLFKEHPPKIVIYSYQKENYIERLLTFFLRWSIKSGTLLVKIQQKKFFWKILTLVPYYLVSRSRYIKQFIRFLLKYLFSIPSVSNRFDPNSVNLDFLFITSLTNNYEDVRVAIFYKRKKVKVFGSVRSWDNLTSHGSLYLEPDLFLAQSEWQSYCAHRHHFIPLDKIFEIGNPAYDNLRFEKVKPNKSIIFRREVCVTFASMGDEINPDDSNFLALLTSSWGEMPSNYKLSILYHPKFKSSLKFVDSRVQQVCFDFSTSKLEDYYSFLKNQSLVICGGTSVLLDCAFTKTPVMILNFDVTRQKYWRSAQRYFDYMDHTKSLTSKFHYEAATSKDEMLSFLKNQINLIKPNESATFFLGTNNPPFSGLDFKNLISSYLNRLNA